MARQPARSRSTKHTTPAERTTLDRVIDASKDAPASDRIDGVLIGRLVAIDAAGRPLVDLPHPQFTDAIPARSTVPLGAPAIGREVAVIFEAGRRESAVLIGLVQPSVPATNIEAIADGERLVLTADREIVLRCGKSSITLTKAGKIVIRGEHLVSRSSGVNRIRGGSIHLN